MGLFKYKFILIRDRASGLVMVDFLKQYGGQDQEASWEPNTEVVIKSFSKWMMHNPAPKWIFDRQCHLLYFTTDDGLCWTKWYWTFDHSS